MKFKTGLNTGEDVDFCNQVRCQKKKILFKKFGSKIILTKGIIIPTPKTSKKDINIINITIVVMFLNFSTFKMLSVLVKSSIM
mgnify:CR=1 FL=1